MPDGIQILTDSIEIAPSLNKDVLLNEWRRIRDRALAGEEEPREAIRLIKAWGVRIMAFLEGSRKP